MIPSRANFLYNLGWALASSSSTPSLLGLPHSPSQGMEWISPAGPCTDTTMAEFQSNAYYSQRNLGLGISYSETTSQTFSTKATYSITHDITKVPSKVPSDGIAPILTPKQSILSKRHTPSLEICESATRAAYMPLTPRHLEDHSDSSEPAFDELLLQYLSSSAYDSEALSPLMPTSTGNSLVNTYLDNHDLPHVKYEHMTSTPEMASIFVDINLYALNTENTERTTACVDPADLTGPTRSTTRALSQICEVPLSGKLSESVQFVEPESLLLPTQPLNDRAFSMVYGTSSTSSHITTIPILGSIDVESTIEQPSCSGVPVYSTTHSDSDVGPLLRSVEERPAPSVEDNRPHCNSASTNRTISFDPLIQPFIQYEEAQGIAPHPSSTTIKHEYFECLPRKRTRHMSPIVCPANSAPIFQRLPKAEPPSEKSAPSGQVIDFGTPVLNAHCGISLEELLSRFEKYRARNSDADLDKKWLNAFAGKLSSDGERIGDFRCYVKGCTQRNKRRDHILTHLSSHIDYRPFTCGHCPARFLRKNECKRHELSHTGIRPYVCDLCAPNKATFIRQDLLKRHLQRTHGASTNRNEGYGPPLKRVKMENS